MKHFTFYCRMALTSLSLVLLAPPTSAQPEAIRLRAFPEARGAGAWTAGGRGGQLIEVTNLNDSGPGSLRAAIGTTGKRVVVFKVGGTITIRSSLIIDHPGITIAGQTSPGGITIRNDPVQTKAALAIRASEVILRYLRIRPGPCGTKTSNGDGLSIGDTDIKLSNIIVDHCSLSWGTDEVLDTWGKLDAITLQWNIIAEGLRRSCHIKGDHSKGALITATSMSASRVSVHHNLFAHNSERNPMIQANHNVAVELVNNVIYDPNWPIMIGNPYGTPPRVDVIGNFVKHGPSTKPIRYGLKTFHLDKAPRGMAPRVFLKGNIGPHRKMSSDPEANFADPASRQQIINRPHISTSDIQPSSARAAFREVLARAGAARPGRDAVDQRLIQQVQEGMGRIIDHPKDVGGWPTIASGNPPQDTDKDGIPDAWESKHRLDLTNPKDAHSDPDHDGYTNLEEFLNSTRPGHRDG